MAEFSTYFENVIINLMRNVDFPEFPAYIALFTSATGLEADNPTAEVSGGSYARQLVGLAAPSGGESSNASDITFPQATGNWGTITHAALVTHATNTNWGTDVHVIMWSPVETEKAIDTGDTYKIPAGDVDAVVT